MRKSGVDICMCNDHNHKVEKTHIIIKSTLAAQHYHHFHLSVYTPFVLVNTTVMLLVLVLRKMISLAK